MQTGSGEIKGVTTILGHQFDTTGVLGYSNGMRRAFPAWATIPSARWLAMGRQWHLFFAWLFVINGVIFIAYVLASRHVTRDLTPTGKDLRGIGKSIQDHLILRHPTGDEAKRYNVLQKLAYASILFIVAPLIVLTGLAMSPTIDTTFPWLLTIFGGRQAARTIHFLACFSFVGFIIIHVLQVVLTGFFNNIRSMVTGWLIVKHEGVSHEACTYDGTTQLPQGNPGGSEPGCAFRLRQAHAEQLVSGYSPQSRAVDRNSATGGHSKGCIGKRIPQGRHLDSISGQWQQ
ncbi:MAG: cytochrome b/b6 domain-containing protein [Nitrospira sp.]|nr:cytochrome b/b6 domain-containing protein [Nitrospira sp.]